MNLFSRKEKEESSVMRVHMTGFAKGEGDPSGMEFDLMDIFPQKIPDGTVEKKVIGKDIDQATVDKYRDEDTGDLYCVSVMENGEAVRKFVPKAIFDMAKGI